MRRIAMSVAFVVLWAAMACSPASGAVLSGTAFNLPPNLVPITGETVTISVYNAQFVNGQFLNVCDAVKRDVSNAMDGTFKVNVPAAPGTTRRFVNVEFARGNATTNVVRGIVLQEGTDYRLDVVVPTAMDMGYPCWHGPAYYPGGWETEYRARRGRWGGLRGRW